MAKRLERAEGTANIELILARRSLFWGDPAAHATIFGVDVTYDGPDSPLSKTIGLGLFGWPSDALLERLEQFFEERGAPVRHQVSPLAGAEIGERLAARGFRPVALSNVLFLDIHIVWDGKWSYDPSILVWEASQHEEEKWLQLGMDASSTASASDGVSLDLLRTELRLPFAWRSLAIRDGIPVGMATADYCGDGTVFLSRELVIPAAPLEEVWAALVKYPVRDGISEGCEVAMMVTAPGSARQKCAERLGFQVAYTRSEWRRDP